MLTKEERENIFKKAVEKPVTLSATKKKGEDGVSVEIVGGAANIAAMSIVILKSVGKLLRETNKELYAMWAMHVITTLADTANDDDDEE